MDMKLLLLLFLFIQGLTGDKPDCKAFYEKTLVPMSVKGEVVKKEKTDDYYLFYVKNENDNGKEVVIRLLKNKTGRMIFMFAIDKSMFIKAKGEAVVRVVVPVKDGLNVQVFPDLCE